MKQSEALRFGAVSLAGMAACCTLTALVAAGTVSVAAGRFGGSIALAVVTGLLLCALVVAQKRNSAATCCEVAPADTATEQGSS